MPKNYVIYYEPKKGDERIAIAENKQDAISFASSFMQDAIKAGKMSSKSNIPAIFDGIESYDGALEQCSYGDKRVGFVTITCVSIDD